MATLTTGEGKHYKLTYNNSGKNIGWYWGAEGGGAFTSGAHKAWLVLPSTASQAPARLGLPGYGDNTTDVLLIPYQAEQEHGDDWYDLFGRKLRQQPEAPGIYIHNGEKRVIGDSPLLHD